MRTKLNFLIIVCILSIVFTKCYNDKANLVYPKPGACDTSNVRLSVELKAIMTSACFSCHGGNAASGGGIKLQDYTILNAFVQNGRLLSSIIWDGKAAQMPLGGAKLSDCDVSKFRAWINKGAPNN